MGVVEGVPLPAFDTGPVAFGYVSAVRGQPADVLTWCWAIAGFCLARGLALRYVFGDTSVGNGAGQVREGWRLLLEHLPGLAGATVLVPSLEDLDGDPAMQARMCAQATAAGAVVQPLMPADA